MRNISHLKKSTNNLKLLKRTTDYIRKYCRSRIIFKWLIWRKINTLMRRMRRERQRRGWASGLRLEGMPSLYCRKIDLNSRLGVTRRSTCLESIRRLTSRITRSWPHSNIRNQCSISNLANKTNNIRKYLGFETVSKCSPNSLPQLETLVQIGCGMTPWNLIPLSCLLFLSRGMTASRRFERTWIRAMTRKTWHKSRFKIWYQGTGISCLSQWTSRTVSFRMTSSRVSKECRRPSTCLPTEQPLKT